MIYQSLSLQLILTPLVKIIFDLFLDYYIFLIEVVFLLIFIESYYNGNLVHFPLIIVDNISLLHKYHVL